MHFVTNEENAGTTFGKLLPEASLIPTTLTIKAFFNKFCASSFSKIYEENIPESSVHAIDVCSSLTTNTVLQTCRVHGNVVVRHADVLAQELCLPGKTTEILQT